MKIQLNLPIELTFDGDHLAEAAQHVRQIVASNTEQQVEALLTVLLWHSMEKAQPGIVQKLISVCEAQKKAAR